ncbi:hypothetical protein JCM3765_002700 [Sporobolomyces pararoseus]
MPRSTSSSTPHLEPHPQPDQTTDPRRRSRQSQPTSTGSKLEGEVGGGGGGGGQASSSSSSSSNRHHPYASTSTSTSSSQSSKTSKKPAPYFTRKKSLDLTTCRVCVSSLENKNDKLKRSVKMDGLDSDPEDQVLQDLEKPSKPINSNLYDKGDDDSSDEED